MGFSASGLPVTVASGLTSHKDDRSPLAYIVLEVRGVEPLSMPCLARRLVQRVYPVKILSAGQQATTHWTTVSDKLG